MAARLAKKATRQWKTLNNLWGVDIPFEQPGAIWIGESSQTTITTNKWQLLEKSMQKENIILQLISRNDVTDLCNGAIRVDPDEIYLYEPDVLQLDSSEILNAMQNAASSLDGVTRNRGFWAMISSIPLRYIAATCYPHLSNDI